LVRAGETQTEVRQRLLREREMKIRSALETLSRKRRLLSRKRRRKELPTASVLGYTNCGPLAVIYYILYLDTKTSHNVTGDMLRFITQQE